MSDHPINPSTLLDSTDLRLTLRATLKPTAGLDRFQPAGFPEIGHVIYDAPRPDNSVQKICIVDSAASMANHLESVCLSSEHSLELASELDGMPYVECRTNSDPNQLVVTTLSDGHRLASTYFLNGLNKADKKFIDILREEFKIIDLGKKSHPLPEQWWSVFSTIYKYDPNSLVHGVLFPSLGIKLPRMLSAHLEAFDASRVRSSGVKFDKLGKTSSGQPIFSVDEETASEIVATFIIDLALLRSFGRGNYGLSQAKKKFLLSLALWKIERLLRSPFRYRSNCDLELDELRIYGTDSPVELFTIDIKSAIKKAELNKSPVTIVYWSTEELFRSGDDEKPDPNDDES